MTQPERSVDKYDSVIIRRFGGYSIIDRILVDDYPSVSLRIRSCQTLLDLEEADSESFAFFQTFFLLEAVLRTFFNRRLWVTFDCFPAFYSHMLHCDFCFEGFLFVGLIAGDTF